MKRSTVGTHRRPPPRGHVQICSRRTRNGGRPRRRAMTRTGLDFRGQNPRRRIGTAPSRSPSSCSTSLQRRASRPPAVAALVDRVDDFSGADRPLRSVECPDRERGTRRQRRRSSPSSDPGRTSSHDDRPAPSRGAPQPEAAAARGAPGPILRRNRHHEDGGSRGPTTDEISRVATRCSRPRPL